MSHDPGIELVKAEVAASDLEEDDGSCDFKPSRHKRLFKREAKGRIQVQQKETCGNVSEKIHKGTVDVVKSVFLT